MSLNFANAQITPNPVSAGSKFIIAVEVWDDEFEFDELATVHDEHQGFADEAQTVGGKLVSIPNAMYSSDGYRLLTSDGQTLVTADGGEYTMQATAEQINNFVQETLANG